ncbi:MAG: hypothetical protein GY711_19200 [bacterium]|nr:hypothetical protein [bacterium]
MLHASLVTLALASLPTQDAATDLSTELARWRERSSAGWRVHVDESSGYAEMLFGASARGPWAPGIEAEWVELARHFVRETAGLHGIAEADLTRPRVVHLPLGMANGSDKVTVRLHQEIGGVPVENGAVNALFDTGGRLLSLHSTAAPRASAIGIAPGTSAAFVRESAARRFVQDERVQASRISEAELVVARLESGPLLAWQVEVAYEAPDEEPRGWRYTFDARSGVLVRQESTVHYFDVTGKVQTMASPGSLPDIPINLPVALDAGYVRLTS